VRNPETTDSEPSWIKSSLSFATGQCVEVADLTGGVVGVRDSKEVNGPVLQFTSVEWQAFIARARNGEYDKFG
jgi:hypothetical protein